METSDILDGYDDATLRAFSPKYLKRNALEKSFKEHIAAEMNIKGEASTVVPVNVQRKRRKSSVRASSEFIFMKQAPPDQHRVEGTTIEEKEANLSTKLIPHTRKGRRKSVL